MLRPDQERTLRWMTDRENGCGGKTEGPPFGGIVAEDVGHGKTHVVARLCLDQPLWPTLIVTPKSLLWQWIGVLHGAGLKDLCVVTSHATAARSLHHRRVVLVTQGCLRGPRPVHPAIAERAWGRLVVDEAHCAKNARTHVSRALRDISAHAKWALTATPVQNSSADLLALARVVGVVSDDVEFVRECYVRVPADGAEPNPHGPVDRADESKECALPPPPRLPALSVTNVLIRLSAGVEAETYAAAHAAYASCAASEGAGSIRAMGLQIRCRQAATHAGLILEEEKQAPLQRVSSKMSFMVRDIAAHRDEKSVVFCDWREEMKLAAEAVLSGIEGASAFVFHGGLSVEDRDDVLQSFAAADAPAVLLAQIRCAACGLNLQCASRVYLMRPAWNPAVDRQAIGRVHRTGQTRPAVTAMRLVATGTVDERCLRRQAHKLKCVTHTLRNSSMQRVLNVGALDDT